MLFSVRLALAVAGAAALGGCAGSSGPISGTPGAVAPAGQAHRAAIGARAQATEFAAGVSGGTAAPVWRGIRGVPGANMLYAAEASDGVVAAFEGYGHGKQIGEFTGLQYPYGVYTDSSKDIWITDWAGKVREFKHATHQRLRTLYGLARPLYVIVDGSGVVYVSQADNGQVAVYQPNSHIPAVLQTPGGEADGLCLDAQGDLFVAYRNGDAGGIVEFPAGSNKGVDLGIHIDQPQGLVVDRGGNIIVAESQRGIVDVFPPKATQPSEQWPYTVPTEISLDEARGTIAVSQLYADSTVVLTKYPFAKDAWRFKLSTPAVQGVALEHGI